MILASSSENFSTESKNRKSKESGPWSVPEKIIFKMAKTGSKQVELKISLLLSWLNYPRKKNARLT